MDDPTLEKLKELAACGREHYRVTNGVERRDPAFQGGEGGER